MKTAPKNRAGSVRPIFGWVVEVGAPRGVDGKTFYADRDLAPDGFSRAVGLGELSVAKLFTDETEAQRTAYWQRGTAVRFARREGNVTTIL